MADILYGELIRYKFPDDLPAGDDVYQREMTNREEQGLRP